MSFSQEKVIIIGAGIVGLMTALELIEHGYHVEIFDQTDAAKAASWAGGGILSPMYPWKYHPAVNQLAQFGKQSYLSWNQKVMPISGIDFEIEQVGMLIFDHDQYDRGLNYAHDFHEPEQASSLLTQEDLHQLNPRLNKTLDFAVYFPQLANVRNPRLTQSVLKYLQQHQNVTIRQHIAITKFTRDRSKIIAALDDQGNAYSADHYVIATGAWTESLIQPFGLKLEIKPIHGQMVLYKTPEKWLPNMCMNNTMYLIPRRDGHIVCGSSTNDFGFDRNVREDISQNIIQSALSLVPDLADFPIVKQWSGLRPGSPTGVPKIGRVADLNNLWMNAGHYRNGLVMAPASARLLREQMQGIETFVDAGPYQI
ncbi:FAD-dependent oxidoreductase [Acinetobacter puyangensis]|uniref:Glycine oxidase n=1 Tax=Acinetobacter puyangensis TaxID=1096779 RepID=A0A240EFE6_9GAMM|nr:glycine oxidase ThiO [Acinetobacter puyangensis]SNX46650.1 glycine oxidase [Acinetobacter puyangensis]